MAHANYNEPDINATQDDATSDELFSDSPPTVASPGAVKKKSEKDPEAFNPNPPDDNFLPGTKETADLFAEWLPEFHETLGGNPQNFNGPSQQAKVDNTNLEDDFFPNSHQQFDNSAETSTVDGKVESKKKLTLNSNNIDQLASPITTGNNARSTNSDHELFAIPDHIVERLNESVPPDNFEIILDPIGQTLPMIKVDSLDGQSDLDPNANIPVELNIEKIIVTNQSLDETLTESVSPAFEQANSVASQMTSPIIEMQPVTELEPNLNLHIDSIVGYEASPDSAAKVETGGEMTSDMPEDVPDTVVEMMPDIPEDVPDTVVEMMPDIPEDVPDTVVDTVVDTVAEMMPDISLKSMPDFSDLGFAVEKGNKSVEKPAAKSMSAGSPPPPPNIPPPPTANKPKPALDLASSTIGPEKNRPQPLDNIPPPPNLSQPLDNIPPPPNLSQPLDNIPPPPNRPQPLSNIPPLPNLPPPPVGASITGTPGADKDLSHTLFFENEGGTPKNEAPQSLSTKPDLKLVYPSGAAHQFDLELGNGFSLNSLANSIAEEEQVMCYLSKKRNTSLLLLVASLVWIMVYFKPELPKLWKTLTSTVLNNVSTKFIEDKL